MRTVKQLAVLLAVIVLALYFVQDKLILFPMAGSPGSQNRVVAGAVPWTDDGQFRGFIFEPNQPPKGTIIFFHGNAGATQYRARYARLLTGYGYRVALQEYPGFGARPGAATTSAALASALRDAEAARKTWTGPMYLMGESFGAGMAAQVAGHSPGQFAGVILITPWDSLADLVNAKFYGLPMSLLLHTRLDSITALKAYTGHVFVVGAENDTLIPVIHAKTLVAAHRSAQFLELPTIDHNDWFDAMHKSDWELVLSSVTADRDKAVKNDVR